ncbi:MAG TPA: Gfo/Idh/MocA family oxidoreductase, partial [Terrimicrobiaceae bacterium]|nr:Gfo/Idh/MocA family oxidoreductase [Terrimicrobiaceae bacterium]
MKTLLPAVRTKRYALVGTGGRAVMFLDPIASTFRESALLVGLCDRNPVRLSYHARRLSAEHGLEDIPVFGAEDFDRMLVEQAPDVVIVCTVDASHDEYIIRALEAGCDVITEKPLTTDAAKCGRILEAVSRTGGTVRVAFNMRWMPGASVVKRLIADGTVGAVKSVVLEYTLDTKHGADYFRRWHSEKSQSGGLLVHKSTHHFDLVNWWMDAIPETVFAFGDLAFYGRANAVSRGQDALATYERYTGRAPESDPFRIDLGEDPKLKSLYLDAEKSDGYIRDRNVFREGIDIEDSLGVVVRYRNGALLTYSLTAFCPSEGFRATINGDRGRIEYVTHFKSHIIRGGAADGSVIEHNEKKPSQRITVHPLFENPYEVEIPI